MDSSTRRTTVYAKWAAMVRLTGDVWDYAETNLTKFDVWEKKTVATANGRLNLTFPPYGCHLLRY